MATLPEYVFLPRELAMIHAITAASKFPNKIDDIHRIEESRFIKFINRSLKISRCFGIYPLVHKTNSTQLSPYLLVYNITLILGFVHATVYIAFFTTDFQELSVINTTIRCMNMFIFVVSLILFSFRIIRRHRQIGYVFEMIESAEKRLSSLGTYFSYGSPPLFQTLLTTSFWASSIFVKCYFGGFKSYFHESIAYYMELLHTFNLYGFSTLLYAVKTQISNATDHLNWVMNNQLQRKRKLEVFENLVEVHEDLCSISSEISKFYSLQLLFTVTAGFISFVANAYFCVIAKDSLVNIAVYFFEAMIGLFQSFMVCSSPVELANKAKKFNTLLYQLMIDDKTNEISENKKLRLHISMKREVVFSACGFFNLDYTLIHSMVAAATTYLVILIQFGQPLNSADPTEHPNTTLTNSSEVSNYYTTPSWIYTTL